MCRSHVGSAMGHGQSPEQRQNNPVGCWDTSILFSLSVAHFSLRWLAFLGLSRSSCSYVV